MSKSWYKGHRFAAYDGESIGTRYVLLASSQGDIYNPEGLSTREILTFLARPTSRHRSESRVMFGMSFDVAHWIRDLTPEQRAALYAGDLVTFEQWGLEYLPRRLFVIHDWSNPKAQQVKIFDVQGYFGGSFLEAVDDWITDIDPTDRALLARGKRERGSWRHWSLARIRKYNALECSLLENLMSRVKAKLAALDPPISPRSWYGPGALAGSLLSSSDVYGDFRYFTPKHVGEELLDPFSRAYFGGRIELLRAGTVRHVYRYDLNSAYPFAMTFLPPLTYQWFGLDHFTDKPQARMSVWHVSWRLPADAIIGPFPFREADGRICYPRQGEGWYWQPEVASALKTYGARAIHVHRGWCHRPTEELSALRGLILNRYAERLRLRVNGDPTARILKGALVAIYGKFSQRQGSGHWYCLPWAGWTTSLVRSLLLGAVRGHERHIIAFSTDGIISDAPLPIGPIGPNLGDWDAAEYRDGTFVLPGVYRLRPKRGHAVTATRSYDPTRLVWSRLLRDLEADGYADLPSKLFVGHQLADQQPAEYADRRLQFVDESVTLNPFALNRKRVGAGVLAEPGFKWSSQSIDLGMLDSPEYPDPSGMSAPIGQPDSWTERAALVSEGETDASF